MYILHVFLVFALAISAAPVVVTEDEVVVVTAIASTTAIDAEPTPELTKITPVKADNSETNLPDSSEDNSPSHPRPAEKKPKGNTKGTPKNSSKGSPNGKNKLKKPKSKPKPKAKDQKPKEQKYFHEPGWDLESGHYDKRFFQGKVPYEQHQPVLRHLIRSYLTTLKSLGVETWLAHGSLLGWWWNGQIMPWDYDLDVQVSVATLAFLGERYNRSTHDYEYDVDDEDEAAAIEGAFSVNLGLDTNATELVLAGSSDNVSNSNITGYGNKNLGDHDGGSVGGGKVKQGGVNDTETPASTTIKKTYLLDINPHYAALTKGNGANIIDARWIDTSNGMFIDITGLRERDPQKSPGVWSCKNNHRYRTGELWPLRRTEFEGVQAWIPYAFDKVLTDEYGPKSLVVEEWAGLVFPFICVFPLAAPPPTLLFTSNVSKPPFFLLFPPLSIPSPISHLRTVTDITKCELTVFSPIKASLDTGTQRMGQAPQEEKDEEEAVISASVAEETEGGAYNY